MKRVQSTDRIGQRFNRLVIIAVGEMRLRCRYVVCRCDCGTEKPAKLKAILDGRIKSCGCLTRERAAALRVTHGESRMGVRSREMTIWHKMRARCLRPTDPAFMDYGGRGITIDKRWMDFGNFLTDMGRCPGKDFTLDRIDNDGPYTPGNCRWASRQQQANNRRSNHLLTFGAVTLTVAEWSRHTRIPVRTLRNRLRLNWSVDRILTTPRRVTSQSPTPYI